MADIWSPINGFSKEMYMNKMPSRYRQSALRVAVAGALLGAWSAAGAGIPIPNVPLFIGNDVPANIFLALDDSGSMDWEVLRRRPNTQGEGYLDLSPNSTESDKRLCSGYNTMAYDPDITYTPWVGVDSSGAPYVNQSITSARTDAYNAGSSTVNLLNVRDRVGYVNVSSGKSAVYGLWTDTDGDGDYDADECPIGTYPDDVNTYSYRATYGGFSDESFVFVDTLAAEQQTNYANWYTYYRKRIFVMKRALSELVSSSQQRMGLGTLWNRNSVGTPIDYMTDPDAKAELMEQLFRVTPDGNTPLQRALNRVGHYFDQTDSGSSLHSGLGFTDASPILPADEGGECQQNFAILLSDGFWNEIGTIPSVGNTDGDGNTDFDGGPTADEVSNTVADVAMKFYERDLAPTITNTVPTIAGVDENEAQHLVTYTVSFGLEGTLSPSSVPTDYDSATAPPPWPTPVANTSTTADDMRHAAYNARGKYLAGQDPVELIRTLNDAFADISARLGSAAAVSATSSSVRIGTLIFSPVFDTSTWSGRLYAQRFLTGGVVGETIWEASELIPDASERNLVTWNDESSEGVPFLWDSLTTAQQTAVGSENILNYIRGDRSLETSFGGPYRSRPSLLGDIISSTPSAVTKEQALRPYNRFPGSEGSTYLSFYRDKKLRTDMVYVGANDGVLHGFRTDTGVEVMGYIPRAVFSNLTHLSSPSYEHRFYADGELFSGDAYIGGSWKSVLLGTTGRGAPAVFALDVSAPTSFDESNVLWEFTDSELGLLTQRPLFTRANNGKWIAIFGNGYNSASNRAHLFIVDLETGALIKKIDTGAGDVAHSNGLAGPLMIDRNGDLKTDLVYAGDLLGNLWKFDLSSDDPADWGIAEFSNDGGTRRPLYQAVAPDGDPQSITTTPTIAINRAGGYQILFGTGRYLATGDDILPDPPTVDTFYGIRDNGAAILDSVGIRPLPGEGDLPSDLLQPQEILLEDTRSFDEVTKPVGILSANPVNYTAGAGEQFGWYIDLASPATGPVGERVVSNPLVLGDLVVFVTYAPKSGCAAGGLTSAMFALNATTGGRTSYSVFDLNADGVFNDEDKTTSGEGESETASMIRTDSTVAPVSLVASEDGNIVFGLTTALDGDKEDLVNIDRIQGVVDNIGRQSWNQLR